MTDMIYDDPRYTYDGQLLPVIGVTYDGVPIYGPYVAPVSAADVAAAVLAALQAATIPVNTVQMNGAPVIGDGSEANMWRGVGVSP